VQDYQEAQDVGGGAFTSSMLEMIEDLVAEGCEEMSVSELYTNINSRQSRDYAHLRTCKTPDPQSERRSMTMWST
jgi:hypothetical protein